MLDRGRFVISPGRVAKILEARKIIIGVRIDWMGYVTDTGNTAHWVVLEHVKPFGINNGICTIYNPYNNALEYVDWRELLKSARKWNSFSGLIIEE